MRNFLYEYNGFILKMKEVVLNTQPPHTISAKNYGTWIIKKKDLKVPDYYSGIFYIRSISQN